MSSSYTIRRCERRDATFQSDGPLSRRSPNGVRGSLAELGTPSRFVTDNAGLKGRTIARRAINPVRRLLCPLWAMPVRGSRPDAALETHEPWFGAVEAIRFPQPSFDASPDLCQYRHV